MIVETTGDLLKSDADFICHQVNYYGSMGGGVAHAIKNKLLSDKSYRDYVMLCQDKGRKLLGSVLYLPGADMDDGSAVYIVANLFCQDGKPQYDGGLTSYAHMRRCLAAVEEEARKRHYSVAIPGYMGCGIAGGNWVKVQGILWEIFGNSPVRLTVVYKEGATRGGGENG